MTKKLMVFLAIAIACAGCKTNSNIKAEFTEGELAWLVYQPNEQISYRGSRGDTLTLRVSEKTDLAQVSRHFPIEAEVALVADTLEYFKIFLLKDADSFKRYFKIGNIYRSLDLLKPAKVEVGENEYNNVYIVAKDVANNDTVTPVKKVYFNKSAGIIRFDFDDDIFYEILSRHQP